MCHVLFGMGRMLIIARIGVANCGKKNSERRRTLRHPENPAVYHSQVISYSKWLSSCKGASLKSQGMAFPVFNLKFLHANVATHATVEAAVLV